jgi:hypothetical protein
MVSELQGRWQHSGYFDSSAGVLELSAGGRARYNDDPNARWSASGNRLSITCNSFFGYLTHNYYFTVAGDRLKLKYADSDDTEIYYRYGSRALAELKEEKARVEREKQERERREREERAVREAARKKQLQEKLQKELDEITDTEIDLLTMSELDTYLSNAGSHPMTPKLKTAKEKISKDIETARQVAELEREEEKRRKVKRWFIWRIVACILAINPAVMTFIFLSGHPNDVERFIAVLVVSAIPLFLVIFFTERHRLRLIAVIFSIPLSIFMFMIFRADFSVEVYIISYVSACILAAINYRGKYKYWLV